jgi:hypothetical protein
VPLTSITFTELLSAAQVPTGAATFSVTATPQVLVDHIAAALVLARHKILKRAAMQHRRADLAQKVENLVWINAVSAASAP